MHYFRILKHRACFKEVSFALVLISKSRRHLPYLLGPVSSFAFYQKRIPLNAFNGEQKHSEGDNHVLETWNGFRRKTSSTSKWEKPMDGSGCRNFDVYEEKKTVILILLTMKYIIIPWTSFKSSKEVVNQISSQKNYLLVLEVAK